MSSRTRESCSPEAWPHRSVPSGIIPVIRVGGFPVADLNRDQLIDAICTRWLESPRLAPTTAFALHVGGLNHRRHSDFNSAMKAADIVYADGGSIVALAKLAGARRLQRAPTTDIGWALFEQLAEELDRLPTIALIGGPPGLAENAGHVIHGSNSANVVLTEHGYHADWTETLASLRRHSPDVCVIGLGAPKEMLWVQKNRNALPPSIVLTCGGWFGFVAGHERRAPTALQSIGMEWLARVGQSPRRLGPRYAKGLLSVLSLVPSTLGQRIRG